MKTASITCFGKNVSCFEFGDPSKPTILFIHGNSAHSGFFLPLIQLMEDSYHILTFDLPGHRESEAWNKEDFTRENLASLFNTVLNHFNVEETDAFGFSMGGLILLECFDLMPAVKRLAVAGHPPLSSVADMPDAYNLTDDIALYLQGTINEDEAERVYNAAIAVNDEPFKHEVKRGLLDTNPLFREGCLLLAQQVSDQVTKLNLLDRQIAIIQAADDLAIQLDYLNKLHIKNLWEQKIQLIPNAGHFMIYENPKELASLLKRYYC